MVQIYHNPNFQLDSETGRLSSWEKCVHIADVNTNNLDEALEAIKNDGQLNFKGHLVLNKKGEINRPTREGDILVHNNQKYLLETFGFLALEDCQLKEKTEVIAKEELKKPNRPRIKF